MLIAALGNAGDSWKPIVDRLPDVAVLTYDRPGCGDAPGRPAPNPALPYSAFADELAELLDQQGAHDPVVLVGLSLIHI